MSANGDESFNVIAARTAVWHHAALHIPNEREVIAWPVDGDDAARIVRLVELVGDLTAAIGRGHSDVFDELSKIIAAATIWCEELTRR